MASGSVVGVRIADILRSAAFLSKQQTRQGAVYKTLSLAALKRRSLLLPQEFLYVFLRRSSFALAIILIAKQSSPFFNKPPVDRRQRRPL